LIKYTKVPVHAMKACKGRWGRDPLILNLSIKWRCVVNITAWLLYPGGWTLVPTE